MKVIDTMFAADSCGLISAGVPSGSAVPVRVGERAGQTFHLGAHALEVQP